ncbi:hypothetical protein SR870_21995 [Rhodopseudomonas palustris]|uniref:hypothetical protein n=1 Tax=Rhodopseudomonas palustris TaxID=1076 RepID=UPI002ACEB6D8|nr:hypothetical protein [Rhodopseudomonas palustris]WQG99310.1 hypothetical protein SR870_21995 [Rhodopseudomonas palustris]
MNDTPIRPPQGASARQARLRDALRENLKRRKLQARGRADQPKDPGDDAGIVQDIDIGKADDAT